MLAPTWEEFAQTWKGQINVAKINGQEEDELASIFDVKGYPSLFIVKDGLRYDHKGGRTLQALKEFAIDKGYQKEKGVKVFKNDEGGATNINILTDSNFDMLTAKGTWLIKFYTPWCGWCKKLIPAWEDLGASQKNSKDIHIAKVDCQVHTQTPARFSVKGFPTIILIKNGKYVQYSGERNVESFTKFIISENPVLPIPPPVPKVNVLSEPTAPARREGVVLTKFNFAETTAKGHWFVAITSKNCPLCDNTYAFLKPFLEKYPSLNYGHVDASLNQDLVPLVSFHTGVPSGHIVYGGRTWMYPGALGTNPQVFERFLNNFLFYDQTKELAPEIRSGDVIPNKQLKPIPGTKQTFGRERDITSTVPLVYKDQSQTINNNTMVDLISGSSWLVEFYTPWCGHCKAFEPAWTETTNSKIGVNFGKVDCDKEKFICSQVFQIGGFPTLAYIKEGSLYYYEGDRDKESLVKFMESGYKTSEKTSMEIPQNVISHIHNLNQAAEYSRTPKVVNSVVELYDEEFELKTKYGVWVVLFYTPDQTSQVERNEFVRLSRDSNGLFFVGQLDSSSQKFTNMKYSVNSVPAVYVFNGDSVFVYKGKIDAISIKKFLGQGISSFQPFSRSEMDATGFASFFINQISLNSFHFQQISDFIFNHSPLLYASFILFAFIVGVFFGINLTTSSYKSIVAANKNLINKLQQMQQPLVQNKDKKDVKKEHPTTTSNTKNDHKNDHKNDLHKKKTN